MTLTLLLASFVMTKRYVITDLLQLEICNPNFFLSFFFLTIGNMVNFLIDFLFCYQALVKITDGKVFELSLTSGRCTKMLPFK